MSTKRLVIVTGATACGKSGYAVELAEQQGGVIINGDSMQLYAEAPVITAQPDAEEQRRCPHLLYGVMKAEDACSAARWVEMALSELERCWQQGSLPIIVGGTGLYLKALIEGMAEIPPIPLDVRKQVRKMTQQALRQALTLEDPPMAEALLPSDTQRMARALEVVRATGKSLLYWKKRKVVSPLSADVKLRLLMLERPRSQLYERINARVDKMIAAGAVEEARRLHERQLSPTLPLMRAVGVRELLDYHAGVLSLEDAIEQMKTSSRHYAKRQLTWFRHQLQGAEVVEMV